MLFDEFQKRLLDLGCQYKEIHTEYPAASGRYISGGCYVRKLDTGTELKASFMLDTAVDGDRIYMSSVRSICQRLGLTIDQVNGGANGAN